MKLISKPSISYSKPVRFSATQIFMLSVIALSALLAPSGSYGQTFSILHRFEGSDGSGPYSRLTRDGAGNLYGTTAGGGTYGGGTVFKLDSAGNETVLHSFVGGPSDGVGPVAGVIRDPGGNLYGTTIYGGVVGCGVVYKVDIAGIYSVLHNFAGGNEGCLLYGMLAQDSAGNLYGTTHVGGTHG